MASAIARKIIPNGLPTFVMSSMLPVAGFLNTLGMFIRLNYDLLLYWSIMQNEVRQPLTLGDDGFRTPDDGEAEYVTWDVERTDEQDVFYLHGALHLYDAGSELKKFTWMNTGIRLIEQVERSACAKNCFRFSLSPKAAARRKWPGSNTAII